MPRPDARRPFLLRAALLLPLAFVFWHWARLPVLGAFQGLADALWPSLFPHGLAWVEATGDAGWVVHTGWPVSPAAGQRLLVVLELRTLARLVAGFPLLLALGLATPGFKWRQLALGVALLAAISWVALTCYAWHVLAVASGTRVSFVDDSLRPLHAIALAPYPAWQYYLSGYLMYLAVLIIPFVTPLVLWAWLFRRFVRRLVVGAQRRVRAAAG